MATTVRTWSALIVDLLSGRDLTQDDTAWAMDQVVRGEATSAQISGFLIALRAKGETATEIAGLASALRGFATPVDVPGTTVDIVGTGGDRTNAVNISTMAAIVAASTGITVVKHGGRAASSASGGSADLVEQLGISLDLSPTAAADVAVETGITFLFAPTFNPGLRHVAAVRRELGVPTAFNILGPLINPADPTHAVVGVAAARMQPVIASVLAGRGCSALVVRGEDGLDKLTTTAASRVWMVSGGSIAEQLLDPRELGLTMTTPELLQGGSAATNAEILHRLLDGEAGPVRDVVLLNAAAALATLEDGPLLERLHRGLERCRAAVESGAAAKTLASWTAASRSLR